MLRSIDLVASKVRTPVSGNHLALFATPNTSAPSVDRSTSKWAKRFVANVLSQNNRVICHSVVRGDLATLLFPATPAQNENPASTPFLLSKVF